ncbi:MAG: hypothetical protein JKX70_00350 [Phycisphaerales bacterium]|nr:hypothetical protein [Phycisphaerales bacterium]
MSVEAAPKQDELIAKREEIIEQLQGEWATRLNWRVIFRGAWKLAWFMFLLVLGFAVVAAMFAVIANWVLGNIKIQDPIYTLVLFSFAYSAGVSFIAFIWSLCYQIYKHRRTSIVIRGGMLDWGEGEPTDLCKLYTKMQEPYNNESYMNGQTLLRHLFVEQWGFLKANCAEPMLIPSQFVRGNELIQMIQGIASINDELEQMNQA